MASGNTSKPSSSMSSSLIQHHSHVSSFSSVSSSCSPSPRYDHTCVVHSGRMWVFGGELSILSTNDMYILDFETSKWEKIQYQNDHDKNKPNSIPTERDGHTAVVMDGEMVVFGGSALDNDVYAFNFANHRWRILSSPLHGRPAKRYGHAAGIDVHSRRMIIFGGRLYTGKIRKDIYEFDLDQHQWHKIVPQQDQKLTPSSRWGHSAVMDPSHRRMIIHGGCNSSNIYLDDTFIFDLETHQWHYLELSKNINNINNNNINTGIAPIPRERHAATFLSLTDEMHSSSSSSSSSDDPYRYMAVYGGWTFGGAVDTVQVLDLQQQRWLQVEFPSSHHSPRKIYGHSLCVMPSSSHVSHQNIWPMVIFGGRTSSFEQLGETSLMYLNVDLLKDDIDKRQEFLPQPLISKTIDDVKQYAQEQGIPVKDENIPDTDSSTTLNRQETQDKDKDKDKIEIETDFKSSLTSKESQNIDAAHVEKEKEQTSDFKDAHQDNNNNNHNNNNNNYSEEPNDGLSTSMANIVPHDENKTNDEKQQEYNFDDNISKDEEEIEQNHEQRVSVQEEKDDKEKDDKEQEQEQEQYFKVSEWNDLDSAKSTPSTDTDTAETADQVKEESSEYESAFNGNVDEPKQNDFDVEHQSENMKHDQEPLDVSSPPQSDSHHVPEKEEPEDDQDEDVNIGNDSKGKQNESHETIKDNSEPKDVEDSNWQKTEDSDTNELEDESNSTLWNEVSESLRLSENELDVLSKDLNELTSFMKYVENVDISSLSSQECEAYEHILNSLTEFSNESCSAISNIATT